MPPTVTTVPNPTTPPTVALTGCFFANSFILLKTVGFSFFITILFCGIFLFSIKSFAPQNGCENTASDNILAKTFFVDLIAINISPFSK